MVVLVVEWEWLGWASLGPHALVWSPPLARLWGFVGVLLGLEVGVIVLAFVIGGWWWKGPVWRWGWSGSVMWVHVELVGWQGLECLLGVLVQWLTGVLG